MLDSMFFSFFAASTRPMEPPPTTLWDYPSLLPAKERAKTVAAVLIAVLLIIILVIIFCLVRFIIKRHCSCPSPQVAPTLEVEMV